MSLHKPEGDVEVQAYKDWTGGQPAKAMQDMRAAGFGEAYRRSWLASVVGVDDQSLGQLELWRDSYLKFLENSDHVRTAWVQLRDGLTEPDAEAKRAEVEKYLPSNYRPARLERDAFGHSRVVVEGYDDAGWTLDDYVIPRLGSGLFAAREVVDCPTCPGKMFASQRECNFCSV